jgi:hypothetical protein
VQDVQPNWLRSEGLRGADNSAGEQDQVLESPIHEEVSEAEDVNNGTLRSLVVGNRVWVQTIIQSV